jgi:L-ribulokinase
MDKQYSIGLDYGTNSVRCLIVDVANGDEAGQYVWEYETGEDGIILDESDHNLARQNPADYVKGLELAIKAAIADAKDFNVYFDAKDIIGIGIDTTGSTPIPVNSKLTPLSMLEEFTNNPNAQAWLWKDHTGHAEAAEITDLAKKEGSPYLQKCGGTYSSEWFFSKILHCLRQDPKVFKAAHSWVECCDYIPAVLTGVNNPDKVVRSRCAAGHKAMFNDSWAGLPSKEFLAKLDPKLAELRDRLYSQTHTVKAEAGKLTDNYARRLRLIPGIPVAAGAFDAHLGAVGSGIAPGKLVKIIGTSTCDMLVSESGQDIPGICGIVDGSILPGYYGLEAGQSAVGDIFNWFVNLVRPEDASAHEILTHGAAALKPGQSGLMYLDWNNGNRTVLVDQRLTGLLVGQTLHTKAEEIYRALIEATAYGALTIMNRFKEYGVNVEEVINCGGIAEKNPLLMQIYADVTGREMKISKSAQSCALGAAIAGAVVGGGYGTFEQAQAAMCGVKDTAYKPIPENQGIYKRLFQIYKKLHDGFGIVGSGVRQGTVMKELLDIKDRVTQSI